MNRPWLQLVLQVLLVVVALPLVLAVALVTLPLVLLEQIGDYLILRLHCRRRACWSYLVVSPRSNWNNVIENNLAPALPEGVGLVWKRRHDRAPTPIRPWRVLIWAAAGQAKPCLVRVTWRRLHVVSLHASLRPLKGAARDPATQAQLRAVLEQVLRERC
ncbi:MAG: hypothetical protein K1X74_00495 [Pirellulales bacterium]|nr:hypothetical protein [Pirellulales bacterium]